MVQWEDLDLDPRTQVKETGAMVHSYSPSTEKAKMGRFLELTVQPISPAETAAPRPMRDCFS